MQFTSNFYVDQTSFWLQNIDINRWITSLNTNKKQLKKLLHANTKDWNFARVIIESLTCIDCMKQMLSSKQFIRSLIKLFFIIYRIFVSKSFLKLTFTFTLISSIKLLFAFSTRSRKIARNQKSSKRFKKMTF